MSLVQYKTSTAFGSPAAELTYNTNPVAGHLLVVACTDRGGGLSWVTPSGWNALPGGGGGNTDPDEAVIFWRVAPGGPVTCTVPGPNNERRLTIMEFDNPGTPYLLDDAHSQGIGPAFTLSIGTVSTISGGVIVGHSVTQDRFPHVAVFTAPVAWMEVTQGPVTANLPPYSMTAYRDGTGSTVSYTPDTDQSNTGGGVVASFGFVPVLTADFSADPQSGVGPLTVAFSDESEGGSGTIDTWLWDFGDGTTSTSQNPTHDYPLQGTYTVTLTVTTDDDETDTEEKVAYILVTGDYVAPAPGGAILEIYAGATGAARWGSARWGQDVWNSAGWVDVTPQGITVVIRWGSHSPERGVLAEVEAASWLVTTYDPDRLLDPGNEDSPYHTDLVAGLPIRLRHRGTVIRQGYAERIAYFHADKQGAIRATDNVSLMARTPVPADSVVADTLRARARDVVAAAGLRITVEPDPPAGDPALAPRIEGDRSVWRHVADAAEQTLHMAYVDRLGTLRFRPWDTPYDRARGVDERNLVDLGTQVDLAGLYSVVQAIDSITETVVERRLTPTPKWGAVTYSRDELTIDAGDWAAAVLQDRSLQTVQWIPGMIWPLTADDVEYFATLEAVERLAVDHRDTDPEVNITGIIVGGEIHVTGKRESAALWSFELELAQTAESPLYTDTDPPEFLRNEAGDGYLYAD